MALNLGPVLCARPEFGLCQMLAAFSLGKLFLLCAGTDATTEGGKRPGTLQMSYSSPDQVNLRTGVHYKSRCLMCGSVPRAAGESCIAILPSSSVDRHQHCLLTLFLLVAPLAYLYVHIKPQNHCFSMGQQHNWEIFNYLILLSRMWFLELLSSAQ